MPIVNICVENIKKAGLFIMENNNEIRVIEEFKGDYRFLSNFYNKCDFEFEGLTYHSSEAAFQLRSVRPQRKRSSTPK